MNAIPNPLTSPAPPEIPLPGAPLVRVIAQVRFPLVASVESQEFIAPFQEAIRKEYPVLRQERAQSIFVGPKGATPLAESKVWRFSDSTRGWRATLAPDFVALESTWTPDPRAGRVPHEIASGLAGGTDAGTDGGG